MNSGEKPENSVKNGVDPLPPTDDPELDALLDDALKDFDNPNLLKNVKKPVQQPGSTLRGSGDLLMDSVWAEEFIKQCTTQFEEQLRTHLKSSLEVPGGSSSKTQLEKNIPEIVEAATSAAIQCAANPEQLSSQLNEALRQKMKGGGDPKAKSQKEEPNFGFPDEAEFARMMGGLGLGGGDFGGDLGDGGGDDESMNEILPFMNNMMQKLLSKELLQPVLQDIVSKYPSWLAQNRPTLSPKDFQKYQEQYTYMNQICTEYNSESPSDSDSLKRQRFERISDLMLKVQYAGPPPQELIGEDTNPLPGFGGPSSSEECRIM